MRQAYFSVPKASANGLHRLDVEPWLRKIGVARA
jgi:hypothetical protein